MGAKLLVDGKEVPLNDFTERMLRGIILGAVSTLRGVREDWQKIQVEITR
ncbi:MAG: hypothetical protein ACE14S_12255 [Candidatus Bathyarchaeia archaeon]